MKLYVYDHCPFCTRARMPFGLKGIGFALTFLANDDAATPIGMIGQKMLPVLQEGAGFMGESLDIVARVDALSGPRLFGGTPDPRLTGWIGTWNPLINRLVIPRVPDPVFPEFATPAARAYFTEKKQASFGDFAELLAGTETHKAALAPALAALVPLLPDAEGAGIDDILLFPILRGLSVVEGLDLPAKVAAYAARMADRSGVPLVSSLRAARG